MIAPGRVIRSPLAQRLQGTRAGIVSRLAACAIDAGIVLLLFVSVLFAIGVVRFLLTSHSLQLADPGAVGSSAIQLAVAVSYLFSAWAGTGRTVGAQVLGLRVVTDRGARIPAPRAFVRAVVCVVIGGPLLLWAAVSKRNAAVYDNFLRTAVIYDWTHE
jgi:uncharacterized RDD family membrane protein YckC